MSTRAIYTSGRVEGLPGRRSWMPVLVSSRRKLANVDRLIRSPANTHTEVAAFNRHARELSRSTNPVYRAFGRGMEVWIAAQAAPDRVSALWTIAQTALDEAMQQGSRPGFNADAALRGVRGLHAAYSGDFATALRELQTSLAINERIDFFPATRAESTLRLAGVCQIILDMPTQALETVAELDAYGLAFYDGAEANDSVLLLARLAHAEGDVSRARELLLQSWFCRTDATIIFSHELARRLEVTDEHERCQRQAVMFGSRGPEGINGVLQISAHGRDRRGPTPPWRPEPEHPLRCRHSRPSTSAGAAACSSRCRRCLVRSRRVPSSALPPVSDGGNGFARV